jgi:hypothetical protein
MFIEVDWMSPHLLLEQEVGTTFFHNKPPENCTLIVGLYIKDGI